MQYDFAIIGAGIVGAASSLELIRRRPGARILLLEKEAAVARHQSGHNSGVVHAGEPGLGRRPRGAPGLRGGGDARVDRVPHPSS